MMCTMATTVKLHIVAPLSFPWVMLLTQLSDNNNDIISITDDESDHWPVS